MSTLLPAGGEKRQQQFMTRITHSSSVVGCDGQLAAEKSEYVEAERESTDSNFADNVCVYARKVNQ